MSQCIEYMVLHENDLGKVGYCYGCESFHLQMNGLLSVVNDEQFLAIENSLESMKLDLEKSLDMEDMESGVQIKITKNVYLCLTYLELIDGLELLKIGQYMKQVNDLVL